MRIPSLPLAFLFAGTLSAHAAVIDVQPSQPLQAAIDQAQPGDTLRLAAGKYSGKIIINKPLTIEGTEQHSAIIEGDRTGRTVSVSAPDVTLKNPCRLARHV